MHNCLYCHNQKYNQQKIIKCAKDWTSISSNENCICFGNQRDLNTTIVLKKLYLQTYKKIKISGNMNKHLVD